MKFKIYHYAKLKNPAKRQPYILKKDEICVLIMQRCRRLGMQLNEAFDDEVGNTTMVFTKKENNSQKGKPMGKFFNTIGEIGDELQHSKEVCSQQERGIADLFSIWKILSPSQTHQMYPNKSVPLTSIRRGITSLTEKGILKKTDAKTKGIYGKTEHLWEYKEKGERDDKL
jgi:hypothetical protein